MSFQSILIFTSSGDDVDLKERVLSVALPMPPLMTDLLFAHAGEA